MQAGSPEPSGYLVLITFFFGSCVVRVFLLWTLFKAFFVLEDGQVILKLGTVA